MYYAPLTVEQKRNCLRLAEILEKYVSDEQFYMGNYGRADNVCGTVGCALGWAAMSGMIPNLGYCAVGEDNQGEPVYITDVDALRRAPYVHICPAWIIRPGDIRRAFWEDTGERFFGARVHHELFAPGGEASRQTVASQLRAYAASNIGTPEFV